MVIPAHGSTRLLTTSLSRIVASASRELDVIVVNDDPAQDVAALVAGDPVLRRQTRVIDMGYNAGFARAVNAGIDASRGELVFIANQDLFVERDFLETLADFLERRPAAACATGKILRHDVEAGKNLDVIDTTGLVIGRTRRAADRGEGERDVGQFDREEQVFGISGTAMLIRRRALEAIKVEGEYFDDAFFMYKEDVDLSWRLRQAGWECWYVPSAVAGHARTSRGLGGRSFASAIRTFHRNEGSKPGQVRLHSMKNQWLMLVKNEDGRNFVRDGAFVIASELAVLAYNVVTAPRIACASVGGFARAVGPALRKRRVIKTRRVAGPRDLRSWFARPNGGGAGGDAPTHRARPIS